MSDGETLWWSFISFLRMLHMDRGFLGCRISCSPYLKLRAIIKTFKKTCKTHFCSRQQFVRNLALYAPYAKLKLGCWVQYTITSPSVLKDSVKKDLQKNIWIARLTIVVISKICDCLQMTIAPKESQQRNNKTMHLGRAKFYKRIFYSVPIFKTAFWNELSSRAVQSVY